MSRLMVGCRVYPVKSYIWRLYLKAGYLSWLICIGAGRKAIAPELGEYEVQGFDVGGPIEHAVLKAPPGSLPLGPSCNVVWLIR